MRANISAKTLQPVLFCNPSKRFGTLSTIARTITHRMAFSTFVSTRLGPIKLIVLSSRTSRAKEPLSTSYNSNLANSSTTSTSIQISILSRASKTCLRSYGSVSAKWASAGLSIQSTSSSVLRRWQQHSASYSSVAAETRFTEFIAPSFHTSRARNTSSKLTVINPAPRVTSRQRFLQRVQYCVLLRRVYYEKVRAHRNGSADTL